MWFGTNTRFRNILDKWNPHKIPDVAGVSVLCVCLFTMSIPFLLSDTHTYINEVLTYTAQHLTTTKSLIVVVSCILILLFSSLLY